MEQGNLTENEFKSIYITKQDNLDYNLKNKYNLCINQGWKVFNNMFVPIIQLITNETKYIIMWSDEVTIKLSKENYCMECGNKTQGNLCLTCQNTDQQKMFDCILQEAGKPFGRACVITDVPCGKVKYAEQVCYSEYILYVGRKNLSWKIGISRYKREGVDSGFLLRILEQGLEEVLIIRSKEKLSLPEAQKLEILISEELGIQEKLTKKMGDVTLEELEKHLTVEHQELNIEALKGLVRIGMFSPWLEMKEAKKIFNENNSINLKGGQILHGKILASWGQESLLKTSEGIKKINRKQLPGKKLLQPEQWYWED